jgi:hypothetical protein
MISVGKDKTKVDLRYFRIGKDLLVIITGGDAHIGAVTLSEEGCYSTLSKKGHKECVITKQVAPRIQNFFKKDVLVVCGIHIDNATLKEISTLVENAKECVKIFLKEFK